MAKGNKFGLLFALVLGSSSQTGWAADPPAVPPANPPANPPTDTPTAASRADALFQEGKLLMEQGKFVDACDKLAESDTLDPAIGTLGLLATCHEQQGRIATAWREYSQTAARADAVADERGTFARERAKALEPELPKLFVRFAVPDANAVVLRNGVRLQPEEIGVAFPMDPGTYEIVVRWVDKPEFRTTVTLVPRKLSEVEIPNPSISVAPKLPDGPKTLVTGTKPPVVITNSAPMSGQTVGAIIAGGVGLVGFGMATAFAVSASSKNSASISIHNTCTSEAACAEGRVLREQALASATLANVGLGVGIVGAGTALVLALLPNRSAPAVSKEKNARLLPWADRNGAGAFVVGHF